MRTVVQFLYTQQPVTPKHRNVLLISTFIDLTEIYRYCQWTICIFNAKADKLVFNGIRLRKFLSVNFKLK